MRVALSIGHTAGSGGKPPATFGDLCERDLVWEYTRHARVALEEMGHEVAILGGGPYKWRQEGARDWCHIYVCCHVNAGAGRYGLVGFDARSNQGANAAAAVAVELARTWDGTLDKAKAQRCTRNGPGDWTERMLSLIEHVYIGKACGLVYEPGFIDQLYHAQMWTPEGLYRTGTALAMGLDAWWRQPR